MAEPGREGRKGLSPCVGICAMKMRGGAAHCVLLLPSIDSTSWAEELKVYNGKLHRGAGFQPAGCVHA